MALNLLTEDPRQPSGAHWCWTRIVPEMASRPQPGETLNLMVSPAVRHYFPECGDSVPYITYPWSNEHRLLRTASEHVISPFLLSRHNIDLLSTAIAPLVNPTPSLVIHMKTMHAYTAPESISSGLERTVASTTSARSASPTRSSWMPTASGPRSTSI